MPIQPGFERCLQFINTQASTNPRTPIFVKEAKPFAITISRQTGSGAHCVAEALVDYLQARTATDSPAWTVFDRNLVARALEEHQLPSRLAHFLPEDRVPELADALDELLGVHPSVWTLIEQTAETIRGLASRGNVILIGRGAHVITSQLNNVFHVRLVGSLERRVQHICELRGLSQREALALILHEDRGRRRYLKKYFGVNIDDPVAYDLTLNTDSVSYSEAARLIGDAALAKLQPNGPAFNSVHAARAVSTIR